MGKGGYRAVALAVLVLAVGFFGLPNRAAALSWDDLETVLRVVTGVPGPGLLLKGTPVGKAYDEAQVQTLAPAFAAALQQSRNDSRNGAAVIPPQIRNALVGFFRPALLDNVRYKVGDRGALNIARLSIEYGEAAAVALIDTIVFADGTDAATNAELWAHEMQHIDQFDRWGVQVFAKRYLRNPYDVELEATQVAFRWWRQSDEALALIRNYLVGNYGMSSGGCSPQIGPARIVLHSNGVMGFTNECGNPMPVDFVTKDQLHVSGGVLTASFYPAVGIIYWSNDTQWYNDRNRLGIIGEFPTIEGHGCQPRTGPAKIVIRNDGLLVAINECGNQSTLRFTANNRIQATNWEFLGGTIEDGGATIRFDNKMAWKRP